VNFQQHEGGLNRNVEVFHNTIVASGTGINVTGADSGFTPSVHANAVFAAVPLALGGGVSTSDNVSDGHGNAVSYLTDPAAPVGNGLDFFPLPAALTGAAIDPTGLTRFLDWDRDFNGTARDVVFRGAYAGEGANPGWPLDLAIKPESPHVRAPAERRGGMWVRESRKRGCEASKITSPRASPSSGAAAGRPPLAFGSSVR
jgi:hypothetical protein